MFTLTIKLFLSNTLSFLKKLTESLGGKININSQEGFGTEVIFTVKEKKSANNVNEESKQLNEINNDDFQSSDMLFCTSLQGPTYSSKWEPVRVFQIQTWDLSERSKKPEYFNIN